MKNINLTAICFGAAFLIMLAIRFKKLEVIDTAFYSLAIAGFFVMGIASILGKKNDKK